MSKVKHIVLLKFKPEITEDRLDDLFNQILDLTESVEGIEDYVSGPNCSPEDLSQGMTHGFVVTFADAAARDAYLAHPEHERVKNLIVSITESALVFDFEI